MERGLLQARVIPSEFDGKDFSRQSVCATLDADVAIVEDKKLVPSHGC